MKSCLRAKKRRHEAKIASQVTPINAFSSIYLIAPKARPTRKKKPNAQSRTLDPARTATELCTKFSAIQSFPKHLPKHSFPEIFQDPESEMDFLQEIHTRLTPATVQAAIYKPAPSSSPGLDLISPGLLRLAWSSPLGQLMILDTVTTSIGRGFIPDWKRALIYPLPKNKPGDYRPISLLSQLSKLCERLEFWMLTADIPLSPAQFGGRGLLSAIDAARLAHHSSVQPDPIDHFLVAALLDISKA